MEVGTQQCQATSHGSSTQERDRPFRVTPIGAKCFSAAAVTMLDAVTAQDYDDGCSTIPASSRRMCRSATGESKFNTRSLMLAAMVSFGTIYFEPNRCPRVNSGRRWCDGRRSKNYATLGGTSQFFDA